VSAIHYRGPIADHRGSLLAGWAACCSGDQAVRICNQGNHTYDVAKVTCQRCLRRMRSHVAYWADPGRTLEGVNCFTQYIGRGVSPLDLGEQMREAGL
jgi:hypothetical protein